MIAGIISGGAVALIWFISALVYLHKRQQRAKRAHNAGMHRRDLPPRRMPYADVKFVIPPDPAFVDTTSQTRPGPDTAAEEKITRAGGDGEPTPRPQDAGDTPPGSMPSPTSAPSAALHHDPHYNPSLDS